MSLGCFRFPSKICYTHNIVEVLRMFPPPVLVRKCTRFVLMYLIRYIGYMYPNGLIFTRLKTNLVHLSTGCNIKSEPTVSLKDNTEPSELLWWGKKQLEVYSILYQIMMV